MIKELPYDLNPFLKSYQYYAYPLGILKSNSSYYYEYCLLNKFSNVFFASNMQFYVDEYKFWNVFEINQIIDINMENFKEKIINEIDNNSYLHILNIDEFYIPSRAATFNFHFLHDILIVGYDENTVISVGYNSKGEFNKEKIDFNKLIMAYTEKTIINVIKIKNIQLDIDINEILVNLDQYFSSQKINKLFKTQYDIFDFNKWEFGLKSMEILIKKIREKDQWFYHNLLICIELKRLILYKIKKIEYLIYYPDIINVYSDIVRKYENIRLKIFKGIVKNVSIDTEITELYHVYNEEKEFANNWKLVRNVKYKWIK